MEDRPDPTKYPAFYKQMHGYGFLPHALIDRFWNIISRDINNQKDDCFKRIESINEEIEISVSELHKKEAYTKEQLNDLADEIYELRRAIPPYEEDLRELDKQLFLAAEFVILGLYKFIEIERNRVLKERFPHLDEKKLFNYKYLSEKLPFITALYGTEAISELRLICNSIKHSGKVSAELAKCNPMWQEGEHIKNLREAYERLAPFIGAYWVDLVYSAKDYSRSLKKDG
jgi:hypothetical protein